MRSRSTWISLPRSKRAVENFRRVLTGGSRNLGIMTDKSVVFRKLSSLREHVTRMRRRRSDDL